MREALHERELSLTTLAPHLVKPLPFLFPLTKRVWERPYIAAGHLPLRPARRREIRSAAEAFDEIGRAAAGSGPQAQLTGRRHPLLRHRGRRRPAHHDGRAHRGALRRGGADLDPGGVASLREGDRVVGVAIRDSEDGAVTEVHGHVVINATGVWTDESRRCPRSAAGSGCARPRACTWWCRATASCPRSAIILRTEKSVLFVIPWGTHWIIGTTDTDWNLDLAHPAATKVDIDYILDTVNTVLATPLTHDDIDGVYAGLRPLLAGESEETSKLSREHAVAVPSPGLVAIAGGKYTTYRVMAEDAVDAAAEYIPTRVAPSITEKVPLMGADGYFALVNQTQTVGARYDLHPYRVRHLLDRYGSLIGEVLHLAVDRPELLEPITDAPVYLKVEAAYAAAAEGALHLEDILARRMRISIEYPHRGVDCAAEVAGIVAPILGWSDADCAREVATYLARVEAEVLSQTQPDDASADALRASAPEARAEILEPVPLI